jgi:Uma2 family endonuclease
MSTAYDKPWTQQEFFAWVHTQDTRYEFDGFQPVAMASGNIAHSRVMRGLHRALNSRLLGGPYEPLGPHAGIETINKAVRFPDALVTCAKVGHSSYVVPRVVAVFEVLNPSSGRTDRILKVREYAVVPSILRYVILESSSIGLTVMERADGDGPWTTTALTNGDILRMPEISVEIPVAEIYEGIAFPDEEDGTA